MLRHFPLIFQRLQLTVGDSVQHVCDMVANQRARLLTQLDRAARIAILGIGDLHKPGHHPRHRPPTVDAALKRDEIAQTVEYLRALFPQWPKERSILEAADLHGVERAYVYRARQNVPRERRQNMKASAAAFADWFWSQASLPKSKVRPTSVDVRGGSRVY